MLVFQGVMVTMKRNHLGEIQQPLGWVCRNCSAECLHVIFWACPKWGVWGFDPKVWLYLRKESMLPCHSGTSQEWNFAVFRRVYLHQMVKDKDEDSEFATGFLGTLLKEILVSRFRIARFRTWSRNQKPMVALEAQPGKGLKYFLSAFWMLDIDFCSEIWTEFCLKGFWTSSLGGRCSMFWLFRYLF